jgi:hypothetical protein
VEERPSVVPHALTRHPVTVVTLAVMLAVVSVVPAGAADCASGPGRCEAASCCACCSAGEMASGPRHCCPARPGQPAACCCGRSHDVPAAPPRPEEPVQPERWLAGYAPVNCDELAAKADATLLSAQSHEPHRLSSPTRLQVVLCCWLT